MLETERLLLRRFTADDVDLLVDLDSDPEVVFFITGGITTPREEVVDEWVPALLGHYEKWPGYGFFAVVVRATGEFVGWVHLRPDHGAPDTEPELGYRFKRSAWGQGYAAEAARPLVDRAFSELGAERVVAVTMVVNTASRRVLEKVGLREVRVFPVEDWPYRIPGDEHGDVEYALTRAEWLSL